MTYSSRGVYLGRDRVLTLTHQGVRLFLDAKDIIITPIVLLNGEWEPETTRAFQSLLKPGMNYVDIGANIGYFTCLAGRLVRPGGLMWAFEADPEVCELLTDNVNLNWFFEGVVIERKAVFDKDTTIKLYKRTKYQGNTSIARVDEKDLARIYDTQEEIEVPAVSLDSYFGKNPPRLDFVKIDIEGAEPYALNGMSGLVISQMGLNICFEWSPNQIRGAGSDPKEVLDFLDKHNFTKYLVSDNLVLISNEQLLANVGHGMVYATRSKL